MSIKRIFIRIVLVLILGGISSAAQEPNNSYVTRQEYDDLRKELDAVKTQLFRLDKNVEASGLGYTKLLITGDAAVGYFDEGHYNHDRYTPIKHS